MARKSFSVFDLLDLPDLSKDIVLHISRNGSRDIDSLVETLKRDRDSIQSALELLIQKGRLEVNSLGKYNVVMGRIQPKTTLPPQIWPSLLTSGRVYSLSEIAVLRTAIPMLQFARAKLSEFSDHGSGHAMRVKSFATQFGYLSKLNEKERFLLRAAALFHDIGNVVDRATHHLISEEAVMNLWKSGSLPMTLGEAELIGLLCRWHRKEYDPNQVNLLNNQTIRTGLLASILRVSDAMDIDHRRSDYDEKFRAVLEFFYPNELPYWTSLENILGLRIVANPDVEIQVFVDGRDEENRQIEMLENDLASTPLPWKIRKIWHDSESDSAAIESAPEIHKKALVIFPFDANNLIMAALSQAHLEIAGYPVELVCYPDTSSGPDWLWNTFLKDLDADDFSRIILIGERFLGSITPTMSQLVKAWTQKEIRVSVINRHEANWHRVPMLIELGAEVVLGGEWSFFWGENTRKNDFFWAKAASLCSRDPMQAQVINSQEEEDVVKGLLGIVFRTLIAPTATDTTGWQKQAEEIIHRIHKNDRAFFIDQAGYFDEVIAIDKTVLKTRGRVNVYSCSADAHPQTFYWALEKSIEASLEAHARKVSFRIPYAIARWQSGEQVEILVVNHWRDEECVPVRFLIPDDLGVSPAGNESTLHFNVRDDQADEIIEKLVAELNREISL